MFTPNDDIMESRRTISRRRALGVGGTVGLAGLIAACAPGTKTTNTAASTSTSAFATSTTSVAAAAANEQKLRELLNAAPGCVTTPEETQGPYYFDVDSIRSNITEDRPGLPLELMIRVQNVEGCVVGSSDNPVANAAVEIWHCDAGGVYSGFEVSSQAANNGGAGGAGGGGAAPSGNPPAGDPPQGNPPQGNPPSGTPPQGGGEGGPGGGQQGDGDQSTSGSVSDGSYAAGDKEATTSDDGTYLRGAQMTDSEGIVRFTSIYPGWYVSRTVHIHVKVHIDRKTVLTTQLFFDDTLSDTINADVSPYNEHKNRDTYNDTDKIFTKEGLVKAEYDGTKVLAAINIGIAA